jgi:ABC-type glycerol-3-phosphate transport system substrate-binding protein
MTMKRRLGPALLAACVLLGACADSSSDTADDSADPTSSATASPTTDAPSDGPTQSDGPVDYQEIAIISQTAAGGEVDLNAVPVDDETARHEFTAQFEQGGMDEKIAAAVGSATIPEGYTVMGAVVAIGCDVPPGVAVSQSPNGWVFTPHKVAKPLQECFAPVTSVALVAVPA